MNYTSAEIDALLGNDLFIVGDTETDGLYPTLVHCAVFKSYPSGNWFIFEQDEVNSPSFNYLLTKAKHVCGHNFLGYDLPRVFKNLLKLDIDPTKIIDTVILSRMYQFDLPGGHGLEAWGERLGVEKPKISHWDRYGPEMLHRCKEDVEINWRLFHKMVKELGMSQILGRSTKIEHRTQLNLDRMQEYGFFFDLPKAERLFLEIQDESTRLKKRLQKDFPPVPVPYRKVKPVTKVTKKLVKSKVLDEFGNPIRNGRSYVWEEKEVMTWRDKVAINPSQVVGDFCHIVYQDFNPASTDQIRSKLENCGWNPINFNKPSPKMLAEGITQGAAKVSDEENLETIPDDAPDSIKNIGHYLIVDRRISRLNEWFSSVGDDQRIHGRVLSIGAKTHRCSHREPNTANIPAILNRKGLPAYMGAEFRSLWGVAVNQDDIERYYKQGIYKTKDQRRLLGVDAEGIQLRVLAHYLNDPIYTKAVLGDLHTFNMFAAGLNPGEPHLNEDKLLKKFGYVPTIDELLEKRSDKNDGVEWAGRGVAKTMIYGFLLGAGNRKLQQVTGIPGAVLKETLYDNIPALRTLQEETIPQNIKDGYFIGIDGRKFPLDNVPPHKVLSIYLQAAEATIMKVALCMLIKAIDDHDYDAFPVAFVHDEFQIDSALHCAEQVKKLAEQSIVKAGQWLNLNCPMGASGRIGLNWKETH